METYSAKTKLDGILVVTKTLQSVRSISCLTFTNKNALITHVMPGHYKGMKFVQPREGVWTMKLGYINSVCLEILIVSDHQKMVDYNSLRKNMIQCLNAAILQMTGTATFCSWISCICDKENPKIHSIVVPTHEIPSLGTNLFNELSKPNSFFEKHTLQFRFLFSQLGGSFSLNGTMDSDGKQFIELFKPPEIDEVVLHIAYDIEVHQNALFLRTTSEISRKSGLLKTKNWFHVCLLTGAGNFTATLQEGSLYPEISQLQIYSKIFSTFHLKESGTPFKSEEIMEIFFAIFSRRKPRDINKLILEYKLKASMIKNYIEKVVAGSNTGSHVLRIEFVLSDSDVTKKSVDMIIESFMEITEMFLEENSLLQKNQYFVITLQDLNKYLLKFLTPCLEYIHAFVEACENSCVDTNQLKWTVPDFTPCQYYSVVAAQIILAYIFYGKATSFKRNIRHNNDICRELGLGRKFEKLLNVGATYNGSSHVNFEKNQLNCSLSQNILNEFGFKKTIFEDCITPEEVWLFWTAADLPENIINSLARFILDRIYGRGNGLHCWGCGTVESTKINLNMAKHYELMLPKQFCNYLRVVTFSNRKMNVHRLDIWLLRFLCADHQHQKVIRLFDQIGKLIEVDLVDRQDFFSYQYNVDTGIYAIVVIPEPTIVLFQPEAEKTRHLMDLARIYEKVFRLVCNQEPGNVFPSMIAYLVQYFQRSNPGENINYIFEAAVDILRNKSI